MHDVAAFERAGLPSVALLSAEFAPQARTQARSLGLAEEVQRRFCLALEPLLALPGGDN